MGRKEDIDGELAVLHTELDNVKGSECEVMQRICGYYRNLKYWNVGKASEYKERVNYDTPKVMKAVEGRG